MQSQLTELSLSLFLEIAGEAKHWDGTPPLEGLRPLTRADNGNLSDLKKHDLLRVEEVDPDNHQVHFTRQGRELAAAHGIELR